MNETNAALAILICALVTAALRFLPFAVFGSGRIPPAVERIGKALPGAVMGMLVVYCLKGVSFASAAGFLPETIAGALVVITYLWKRNSLLSILSGTVCYMLLVQLVFAH